MKWFSALCDRFKFALCVRTKPGCDVAVRSAWLTQPEIVAHEFHHLIELTRDVKVICCWRKYGRFPQSPVFLCSGSVKRCIVGRRNRHQRFWDVVLIYTRYRVVPDLHILYLAVAYFQLKIWSIFISVLLFQSLQLLSKKLRNYKARCRLLLTHSVVFLWIFVWGYSRFNETFIFTSVLPFLLFFHIVMGPVKQLTAPVCLNPDQLSCPCVRPRFSPVVL
jgi:hypothetical protein